MLKPDDKIFTNLYGEESSDLKAARARGCWLGARDIATKGREWIIDEVKKSDLRGRGGAGFATGMKWSFISKDDGKPHYLVVNADESEPGTCKDRDIIRHEPQRILEGALYASIAIGAHVAYIYIRGEFFAEYQVLQKAVDEAYAAGLLGKNAADTGWDFDVYIHRGAGAYICGEETAQLNSLEGKRGMPRNKPPFPAGSGLYSMPTTINNVETIAAVPEILRRGGAWFASIGREKNRGTKIFCISGHVNKPCTVEDAMGIPLRELIEKHAGGVRNGWDNLLAVQPGGSSTALMTAEMCDKALMDYDGLREHGSSLGTGAVIVMDKSTDLVDIVLGHAHFYWHESCGQCTPCREGTGWLYRVMQRIAEGKGDESDIEQLLDISCKISCNTICAHGDAAIIPIRSFIKNFRPLIEQRIKGGNNA